MKSQPHPRFIRTLLNLKLGRSRLRGFVPTPLKDWVRIQKYNLLLAYLTLSRARGRAFFPALLSLARKRPRVLFYPDLPGVSAVLYQVCLLLGCRITNDPKSRFDLALRWRDATRYTPDAALLALAEKAPVLNLGCLDIDKATIDQVFRQVFGYGSLVDPRTHQGACVRKSEENARHDGQVVQAPIPEPEAGYIYQRLIDNRIRDDCVLDLRVPVYRGRIPFAALWEKPLAKRFSTRIDEVRMVEASQVFSPEELERLLAFCERMGLDYGELDVLRDRTDGRLYVVDVNNTPTGPTREPEDLQLQAQAFAELLRRSGQPAPAGAPHGEAADSGAYGTSPPQRSAGSGA